VYAPSTTKARSSTFSVSPRRDNGAARRFFARALTDHGQPVEILTDKAHALALAVDEFAPRRSTIRVSTRTAGSKLTTAG
jgi:transposase-like protein